MPWVLPTALEFPDLYEDFIGFFSFLNIGLLPRFVRLECEVRVDHYGKVVTMTLAPLVITSIGLLVSLVHQSRVADKAHLRAWYFGWFLAGTYLIYPSVSTTLFQTLRCEVFNSPAIEGDDHVVAYLRADLRLECGRGTLTEFQTIGGDFEWNSRYNMMWWYAVAFVFVYPFGETSAGRANHIRPSKYAHALPALRYSIDVLHPALLEP